MSFQKKKKEKKNKKAVSIQNQFYIMAENFPRTLIIINTSCISLLN